MNQRERDSLGVRLLLIGLALAVLNAIVSMALGTVGGGIGLWAVMVFIAGLFFLFSGGGRRD